jgi:hypothetical protein
MSTKRKHEGYLMLDHSNSPGLPDEIVANMGLPLTAGRAMFEAPTYTCNHCCRVVFMNPLRTRDREYCIKCNHYVCDNCGAIKAATGECRTVNQIIEEAQEAASRQLVN